MHVALISRDDSLKQLCRVAVAALAQGRWSFATAAPEAPTPVADLYLWDFEPQMDFAKLTAGERASRPHMLLIGRQDGRHAMAALPSSAVTLMLKPVDRDALQTFLLREAGRTGSLCHDRDAILESLLATTVRLQECDQDRMNFLARAVHDFRTPLTAVNGYCGLLLSGEFGSLTPSQQEVLERTLHSVRRLSRLATALFQWSMGLRVGLQSSMREGDIEECCRQALHEIRPLAAEKDISVDLDLQAPGEPMRFDPAQMEQLLVNLLENSCKFTPRGGYIQVRGFPVAWQGRRAYRMEVSDDGMGVRPEHLSTIFQEYTSYGGGADRSGSGLGLAICKRILAEHGGEIYAESGNRGVTFILHLPFTSAEPDDCAYSDRSAIHLVAETVGGEKQ